MTSVHINISFFLYFSLFSLYFSFGFPLTSKSALPHRKVLFETSMLVILICFILLFAEFYVKNIIGLNWRILWFFSNFAVFISWIKKRWLQIVFERPISHFYLLRYGEYTIFYYIRYFLHLMVERLQHFLVFTLIPSCTHQKHNYY